MSESDCFLRFCMRCNAEFYYVGKIRRIAIGRPSLQRHVVLKCFYSPRAVGTPLSEVQMRARPSAFLVNSQTSHIECNRYGQNQHYQFKLYSKCPPLAWAHAHCLPRHWSTASSKINCLRPHQTSMNRHFNVSTLDLSVVDTMLHDSQDLVVHRTEIWAVWRP